MSPYKTNGSQYEQNIVEQQYTKIEINNIDKYEPL